jgi:hypothetical protein
MSQYPANGVLFQNNRKQGERQPDYTGNLAFDPDVVMDLYNQLQSGIEQPKVELASWRKTSRNGNPFLSLKASIPYERREEDQTSRQEPPRNNNLNDEIPF